MDVDIFDFENPKVRWTYILAMSASNLMISFPRMESLHTFIAWVLVVLAGCMVILSPSVKQLMTNLFVATAIPPALMATVGVLVVVISVLLQLKTGHLEMAKTMSVGMNAVIVGPALAWVLMPVTLLTNKLIWMAVSIRIGKIYLEHYQRRTVPATVRRQIKRPSEMRYYD